MNSSFKKELEYKLRCRCGDIHQWNENMMMSTLRQLLVYFGDFEVPCAFSLEFIHRKVQEYTTKIIHFCKKKEDIYHLFPDVYEIYYRWDKLQSKIHDDIDGNNELPTISTLSKRFHIFPSNPLYPAFVRFVKRVQYDYKRIALMDMSTYSRHLSYKMSKLHSLYKNLPSWMNNNTREFLDFVVTEFVAQLVERSIQFENEGELVFVTEPLMVDTYQVSESQVSKNLMERINNSLGKFLATDKWDGTSSLQCVPQRKDQSGISESTPQISKTFSWKEFKNSKSRSHCKTSSIVASHPKKKKKYCYKDTDFQQKQKQEQEQGEQGEQNQYQNQTLCRKRSRKSVGEIIQTQVKDREKENCFPTPLQLKKQLDFRQVKSDHVEEKKNLCSSDDDWQNRSLGHLDPSTRLLYKKKRRKKRRNSLKTIESGIVQKLVFSPVDPNEEVFNDLLSVNNSTKQSILQADVNPVNFEMNVVSDVTQTLAIPNSRRQLLSSANKDHNFSRNDLHDQEDGPRILVNRERLLIKCRRRGKREIQQRQQRRKSSPIRSRRSSMRSCVARKLFSTEPKPKRNLDVLVNDASLNNLDKIDKPCRFNYTMKRLSHTVTNSPKKRGNARRQLVLTQKQALTTPVNLISDIFDKHDDTIENNT